YAQRMFLYRELGIMELDDCGMWIDRPFKEADWLSEEQLPMPPCVPQQWLVEAGLNSKDFDSEVQRHPKSQPDSLPLVRFEGPSTAKSTGDSELRMPESRIKRAGDEGNRQASAAEPIAHRKSTDPEAPARERPSAPPAETSRQGSGPVLRR